MVPARLSPVLKKLIGFLEISFCKIGDVFEQVARDLADIPEVLEHLISGILIICQTRLKEEIVSC